MLDSSVHNSACMLMSDDSDQKAKNKQIIVKPWLNKFYSMSYILLMVGVWEWKK